MARELTQRELGNESEAIMRALDAVADRHQRGVPFDANAARAYGRVAAAVLAQGRKAGAARVVDLLIAATAVGAGRLLSTRNGDDLRGLDELVDVVVI